jgi:predicted RNase H-like HicB family nuclease
MGFAGQLEALQAAQRAREVHIAALEHEKAALKAPHNKMQVLIVLVTAMRQCN